MKNSLRPIWLLFSSILTALSLINATKRYFRHWQQFFIDVADVYHSIVTYLYFPLELLHVNISDFFKHAIIIYSLFGASTWRYFFDPISARKDWEGTGKFGTLIWRALLTAFWPLAIIAALSRNIWIDIKFYQDNWKNRARVVFAPRPSEHKKLIDKIGALIYIRTWSTTLSVLFVIATFVLLQCAVFLVVVAWSLLS